MPNLPKWPRELVSTEEYDETKVAWQEDNPCDGCGCYHYTLETACTVACTLADPAEQPQHCGCWYDCDPCCKCGDHPNVLHGPALPGSRL